MVVKFITIVLKIQMWSKIIKIYHEIDLFNETVQSENILLKYL